MAMLVQLVDGVASTKFVIAKSPFTIGRAPGNDLYIEDALVSAHHAQIEIEPGAAEGVPTRYRLRDLGSTNCSFLNEAKVDSCQELHNQDRLRFGLHNFLFLGDEAGLDVEKTKKIKKSWIPGVYYTKD